MNYAGYYINLDRNTDRRQTVENQLAACHLGPAYRRYSAALGNVLNARAPKLSPGAIGCFTSHYLLLKSLIGTTTHVHVVEDDILFASTAGASLNSVIQAGLLDKWDMLYTDVWVPIDLHHIRDLSSLFRGCATLDSQGLVQSVGQFTLLNLKDRLFASTVSYLVNRQSVQKIVDLLASAFETELKVPIDIFYRQQVHAGNISAACLFPFITSVNIRQNLQTNISNTSDPSLQRNILASTMLRNLFFIDSDPQKLLQVAEQYLGSGPINDRDRVLDHLTRFAASPDFKFF